MCAMSSEERSAAELLSWVLGAERWRSGARQDACGHEKHHDADLIFEDREYEAVEVTRAISELECGWESAVNCQLRKCSPQSGHQWSVQVRLSSEVQVKGQCTADRLCEALDRLGDGIALGDEEGAFHYFGTQELLPAQEALNASCSGVTLKEATRWNAQDTEAQVVVTVVPTRGTYRASDFTDEVQRQICRKHEHGQLQAACERQPPPRATHLFIWMPQHHASNAGAAVRSLGTGDKDGNLSPVNPCGIDSVWVATLNERSQYGELYGFDSPLYRFKDHKWHVWRRQWSCQ